MLSIVTAIFIIVSIVYPSISIWHFIDIFDSHGKDPKVEYINIKELIVYSLKWPIKIFYDEFPGIEKGFCKLRRKK